MPEAEIDLEFPMPKTDETVTLPKMIDDEGHVLADVEFPTPSIITGHTVHANAKTVDTAAVSKKVVSTTDKK